MAIKSGGERLPINNEVHNEKRVTRLLYLGFIISLLLIVPIIVFGHVCSQDFVEWDDQVNFTKNWHLHPANAASLAYFWRNPFYGAYIPITRTLWVLLASLSGPALNPHLFHFANLVVHVINVFLVFIILRLLVRRDWPACLGALLFAIHPLQAEPVAWATGMRDLLSGTFSLLAIWQYLRYTIVRRDAPHRHIARRIHYGVALVCYILALLSKSASVSLPLLIWVIDCVALGREARQSARSLLPWILIALPIIIITKQAESQTTIPVTGTLWGRPFVAGDALAFYLWKLLIPLNLGMNYGRTPSYILGQWWGYATWTVPACVGVFVWLRRKSSPWLLTASAISLSVLLPVLGLVLFAYQLYSTVADRYFYLALLGPALALAWLNTNKRYMAGIRLATVLILCAFGSLSMVQVRYWDNTFTLFEHAIVVNPRNGALFDKVADLLDKQGRTRESLVMYSNAVRINPDDTLAHSNLGIGLMQLHNSKAAVAEFREVLRIDPKNLEAHSNLADALCLSGRVSEAIPEFREALRLNPNLSATHVGLGVALASQGNTDEAILELRRALQLQPDYPQAKYLLDKLLAPHP